MREGEQGLLSIVGTPIGNLEDITLRALRVLREADAILAEDTRHTRTLLTHHAIATRLRSFHAHSSLEKRAAIVGELEGGARFALVTDAGMPTVSDPGRELVDAAIAAGVRVEAIPGASASTTALACCGLDASTFRFVGFLPRSGGKRTRALAAIADDTGATVLFESPNRVADTLRDLAGVLAPERRVAVCRELTKRFEEVLRGTATELAEKLEASARGEMTLVIEASSERRSEPVDLASAIAETLREGKSPRDVARELAVRFSMARKDVYAQVVAAVKTAKS